MTLTELVKSVEVITDDEGNKKAILDWQTWEEIVTFLEGRIHEPDSDIEDQMLVNSGVLSHLIEEALQEQPSADWEQERSEL